MHGEAVADVAATRVEEADADVQLVGDGKILAFQVPGQGSPGGGVVVPGIESCESWWCRRSRTSSWCRRRWSRPRRPGRAPAAGHDGDLTPGRVRTDHRRRKRGSGSWERGKLYFSVPSDRMATAGDRRVDGSFASSCDIFSQANQNRLAQKPSTNYCASRDSCQPSCGRFRNPASRRRDFHGAFADDASLPEPESLQTARIRTRSLRIMARPPRAGG